MSKTAKSRSAKRPRVIRTRRATVRPDAAAASTLRSALPRLCAPVMRETRRDRIDVHLFASGNCQTCFGACARLPIALQSVCRHLCSTLCTA